MAIHKEGYKILLVGFVILIVLNVVTGIIWSESSLGKMGISFSFHLLYTFSFSSSSVFLPETLNLIRD